MISLRSISDSNLTVTCLVDRTEFVNKPNYVPVGVFDNLPHRGKKAYKYMNSVPNIAIMAILWVGALLVKGELVSEGIGGARGAGHGFV